MSPGFVDSIKASEASLQPRRAKALLAPLAWVLILCCVTGCLPKVRIKPIDPLADGNRSIVATTVAQSPSQATLQTLRLHGLDQRWQRDPRVVLAILNQLHKNKTHSEILASLAELALLEARRVRATHPRLAAGLCLLASSRAYLYLFDGRRLTLERAFDRRFQQLRDVYNISLGLYIELYTQDGQRFQPHRQETLFGDLNILIAEDSETLDPGQFETLLPTLDLKVKGPRNHYYRDGLGTTLVAYRENRGRSQLEDFFPPEGIVRPVTAVLEFEPPEDGREDGTIRLFFYPPQLIERVSLNGQAVPLAADFTTPYGFLLSQAKLKRLGYKGLVSTEKALGRLGLYLLEPYDPDQIPIVMVHGLGSSPIAWMDLTNDLNGDPDLRARYQVWHFMYPTSLPYLFTGKQLRRALKDLRQALDPEGQHAAMQSMVFIAHSMGGLLTKTLVSDSGSRIWRKMFNAPAEDLNLDYVDRELIQDALIFKPLPYVDRVIFIATPHRGSSLASSPWGRLGSSFVRLPKDFMSLFQRVTTENSDFVEPSLFDILTNGGPTSIRALAPDHPLLLELADLPIASEVPYHSIIGDRGKDGDLLESSDGVVPYRSSHLKGAISEFIVPSGHNAYSHPFAIAEIKRILKLHLEDLKTSVQEADTELEIELSSVTNSDLE